MNVYVVRFRDQTIAVTNSEETARRGIQLTWTKFVIREIFPGRTYEIREQAKVGDTIGNLVGHVSVEKLALTNEPKEF